MFFSASKIKTFKDCKRMFYFRYLEKLPEPEVEAFIFGSAFHEAMATGKTENPVIGEMIHTLDSHEDYAPYKNRIAYAEKKEFIKINGKSFIMIMDAVGDDFIIDYKTAGKLWEPEKAQEELQPTIYLKGLLENNSKIREFVYFIVTKPGDKVLKSGPKHYPPKIQKLSVAMSREELEKKWKEIERITDEMLNEFEFPATAYKENRNKCFFCPFKDNCEVNF